MSKGRVLVVDDSHLIRQVILDAFTSHGYDVVTAADGKEALDRITEAAPILIIADILMPSMDGWALCEEVRRRPATSKVPFIFLTTERDVPKRIKGLESGADDYVCKPFSKEELFARSEALLRRLGPIRNGADSDVDSAERPLLSGHTSLIAMPDLLQLLSMNSRTGTLSLSGQSVARIFFREGRIINAETQGLRGEKALFRVMSWPEARFEFQPGEQSRPIEEALTESTSSVLMEGFAHLDELRDLIARLPSRGQLLKVSRKAAKEFESMDLCTAERIVLFTAGERGATLKEIVDTVPERDLLAYTTVESLLERGLLEIVAEDAAG